MILNAYAVLAAFVAIVEAILGLWVAGLALHAWRARRTGGTTDPAVEEGRLVRALLPSFVLLGVSVASWPLLYLLLDSYVPEWPGVMCIQGVTRIGTGSLGAAGWLPSLVRILQATKPALVFGTGAWLVMHLANRRTRTAPWTSGVLALVAATGALAALDASAQLAYVGIPKKESFLARGCCTADTQSQVLESANERGGAAHDARSRRGALVSFYGIALAVVLGGMRAARRAPAQLVGSRGAALPLAVGALLSLPVGAWFLTEVAAPAFLRLEAHHCAYCLLAQAPLGVLAVVLFVGGAFSFGWASILRGLAPAAEDRGRLGTQARALLAVGLGGYVGALLLVSARLVVA